MADTNIVAFQHLMQGSGERLTGSAAPLGWNVTAHQMTWEFNAWVHRADKDMIKSYGDTVTSPVFWCLAVVPSQVISLPVRLRVNTMHYGFPQYAVKPPREMLDLWTGSKVSAVSADITAADTLTLSRTTLYSSGINLPDSATVIGALTGTPIDGMEIPLKINKNGTQWDGATLAEDPAHTDADGNGMAPFDYILPAAVRGELDNKTAVTTKLLGIKIDKKPDGARWEDFPFQLGLDVVVHSYHDHNTQ